MDDVWGKLTWINEQGKIPVLLSKRKFVIGRAKDCDLSLGCKSVSKHHCHVEVDDDGQVRLCDTSSNGTLLNKTTRVTHNQSVVLKSGDEFCIGFRKDVHGIGFLFESVKEMEEDLSADDTQEYSLQEDDLESEKTAKGEAKSEMQAVSLEIGADRAPNKDRSEGAVTLDAQKKGRSGDSDDEMVDHLTCSICQDIIYKCVSLLPCMHCFCSGCYSDWMVLSQECPQCRVKVRRLAPNHIIGGLIDTYLKRHPDKQRDEEDLKEADSKNRITKEMLFPKDKNVEQPGADSDEDDDEDLDDSGSSAEDTNSDNELAFVRHPARRRRLPLPHVKFCRQCPDQPEPKRQKKGYEAEVKGDVAGSSTQPPTVAGPQDYVCDPTTVHTPCRCCFKQMPDRSRDRLLDNTIPPQSCALCPAGVMYCHMYWGCDRLGCTGCLSTFRDVVLADNCLDQAVNSNPYESSVLVEYLKGRKKTWRDVLAACLPKLDAGEYVCVPAAYRWLPRPVAINSLTVLCKECAYKCFGQLAYQYRKDVATEDLPDEVKAREDCYWGRNCRTQTKHHHAKKFNHICEQTRFK